MKMRITSVLSCLLIGISLTGCTSVGNGAIDIVSVDARELQAPLYGGRDSVADAVAGGANSFAFALSAALAKQVGNENFVCSPYSVWLPLAALVNATDQEHKAEVLSALHASGIGEADVNHAASRMLYDLTRQEDQKYAAENNAPFHNPLRFANAVFVGKDATLKDTFAQLFMDFYRGSAIHVDFSSDEAVESINAWVNENTDGLVPNIVQEFEPGTVAAIANAIYFSDRWEREFNPEQTTQNSFHSPVGDVRAFYMLREGDNQRYYEDEKVQAMPLTFKTGGGMYIILPKDGDAVHLLSTMTNDYFREIQADSIYATGKLLLPRFSIESDAMQLKDALIALGVPLFDEAAAPLTNGLVEEDIPMWLTGAVHKAVIQVDEKGTTAAAVTIIPAAGAAMPQPTEPFEMNCNRPFVFVLFGSTQNGGNQILFTGIVNQPQ